MKRRHFYYLGKLKVGDRRGRGFYPPRRPHEEEGILSETKVPWRGILAAVAPMNNVAQIRI